MDTCCPAPARPSPLVEGLRFLQRHWIHLVLAPLMALTVVTLLHELAHAAAVWVQGGEVTHLRFVPDGSSLGRMSYRFAPGVHYSPELVSLAPYLLWSSLAAGALLCALFLPARWRGPRSAPLLFVWLYVVPLLDIGVAIAGYLGGATDNDLTHALGPPDELAAALLLGLAACAFALGHLVQRRLYGNQGLSAAAYLVVSLLCGAVLAGASLAL